MNMTQSKMWKQHSTPNALHSMYRGELFGDVAFEVTPHKLLDRVDSSALKTHAFRRSRIWIVPLRL